MAAESIQGTAHTGSSARKVHAVVVVEIPNIFGEEFSSENLLLCSSSKVLGDIWKQSVPTVNSNMAPGEVSIRK